MTHRSCSMQNGARKNSKYSKNEIILKIAKNSQQGRAIAFAKWFLLVKN